MSLLKYKVMQSDVVDGVVSLPEKAISIGVLPDAKTSLPVVAFIMLYSDWAVEFPEEAKREELLNTPQEKVEQEYREELNAH